MKCVPKLLLTVVAMSGCTVGPDYRAPRPKVPANFTESNTSTTQPSAPTARPVQITEWWATFHDPELDSLIERGERANPSLLQAESRIRQARYSRIIAGAAQYPNLNIGGGYLRSLGSRNVSFPLGAFGGGSSGTHKQVPSRVDNPPTGSTGGSSNNGAGVGGSASNQSGAPLSPLGGGGLPGVQLDLYQVGFDASWEVDVFGGVRRSVEASNADLEAAIDDRRDVLVSLLSEVATNYIELRGYQREVQIALENLKSQQQSLALTQDRFRAGVTTQLDVARAQAQVSTTAATLPDLDASIHEAVHRIGVLLGQDPSSLLDELTRIKPIPSGPAEVPIGVPADLLRRRPDIRRAERQLAAATARVGVAVAELYPKFTINGTFGLDATKIARIADWPSHYYSLGPGVTLPIFNAGQLRANVRVQSENQAQALSIYEQTVLVAMQDVEDSLVIYSREQRRRLQLADAVEANRQAVDLATQQYQQGVVDFLTVLEAQRSLYGAQDALVQSDTRISTGLVSLYKALGGGWETPAGPPRM